MLLKTIQMHVSCLANAILIGNDVHFYLCDNCFGPDDERGYFKNTCKKIAQ